MKKFFALVLTVVIAFSALTAGAAAVPNFMKEIYTNYTADYKVSISIENADEIVGFLAECEILDEISKYVDAEALINSLCTVNSTMNIKADISEDFRRMKIALTSETKQDVKVNVNFDASYRASTGMWIDMDIDAKKLIIVYSTPATNKYAVVDVAKNFPAEVSEAVFGAYDKLFNKENMKKMSEEIMTLAMKYADVKVNGDKYIVKYDNDAFVSAVEDMFVYVIKMASDIAVSMGEEPAPIDEIPSFDGIKLLGDDGITCTYKLAGNKIKSVSEKWDVSIGLASIYTKITGDPWEYEFDGDINMTFTTDVAVTKIGTTHAAMPELTEENSFAVIDMFSDPYAQYETYEPYEEEHYKSYYTYGYSEIDIFDGEKYYMPVRQLIEDVYWDCSEISYDNGLVTINTYCDEEADNINVIFNVGEDKAVVNGVTYENFGGFKIIEGSVYAPVQFYENCLGWTLEELTKHILAGGFSYGFTTGED